jgi:hypothetical protein
MQAHRNTDNVLNDVHLLVQLNEINQNRFRITVQVPDARKTRASQML